MPPPVSLSLGKKPTKPPTGPKKAISAFAAAADSDSDNDDAAAGIFAAASTRGSSAPKKKTKDVATVNAQLRTISALSQKAEAAAADVDPAVYDYDGVWDSMKAVDRRKKAADEVDALERKPKYMANLLESAEVRKRDALRAKEKALAREREAEGDEFEGKEKFVTEAYKRQQEEVRKAEEEEKRKEEEAAKRGKGMVGFHRNMLDRLEGKHEVLVKAAEMKVPAVPETAEEDAQEDAEKRAAEKAKKLREQGAAVEVNEEGLVVDKTQLLTGGLNVTAPKKAAATSRPVVDPRRQQGGYRGADKSKQDLRARQTKLLEDQLAEATKRARDEEEREKEELERASKSRKTETDVMSAKERYLARKAAAAAAAAKKE